MQESIYDLSQGQEEAKLGESMGARSVAGKDPETESIYSTQTGVTQVSAITYATDMLGITADTTFLLLDLRDPEDYSLWRIKESVNYPAPNIARDKVIPELYRFKNKPDKLIVVYMADERKGTQAAQLFNGKGYENVYRLSGGIEKFVEEFAHLCEGTAVPTPKSAVAKDEERKREERAKERQMKREKHLAETRK